MANDDRQQTIDEFEGSVNMTREELEDSKWRYSLINFPNSTLRAA
jgi:hypothetical protein